MKTRLIFRSLARLVFLVVLDPGLVPAADVIESDLCIYGGTSGGVAAAVQAARMGKSVVLVEPGRHVGGMTSGGLGLTDTGNIGTIGGVSREFYRRVGGHYGTTESFKFEPHVAEQVFLTMLQEVGVPVYFQERLARVLKEGQRITLLEMESGRRFRAGMFIDTTYEGDLLALAGVSFVVGREATAAYGESLNGIRASTPSHQFVLAVDPYVIPGQPGSGLLPFIQPGDGGQAGQGDRRVQAYNFRLCLTQSATNKIPIAPPPGYDPTQYELLGRYIAARVASGQNLTLNSFLKIDAMPNGKTDINNNGAFSTDYIGMNYTYPTNTYAERARLWLEHESYIRGFLTFLANDLRVPAGVRASMQSYGLCRDEFQDTGGWPHQMYVREARRMVSDYVITQADCERSRVAADSVGLASYNMDSHNCQRVVRSGAVTNEGDVQRAPAGPFPISYRAIIPRRSECENLFATFCLSGTHIAFSSCRMEPVFMITSQSAATAAVMALDDGLAVQDVDYSKLRLHLLADRQVLQWGSSTDPSNGIVLDCEQTNGVTVTGAWTSSTSQSGFNGASYLHDQNAGKGSKSVRFTPTLLADGMYTVSLKWTTNPNRATNVPITIFYAGGQTNLAVNQQLNNGVWYPLARLPFTEGTAGSLLISTAGTGGYVIADATLWEPLSSPTLPTIEVVVSDSVASEDALNPAVFTFVRSGSAIESLTVHYTVNGTATPGDDYPTPSGSLVIPAGQVSASLRLVPRPDPLAELEETVRITISPDTSYSVGAWSNATAVVRDGGFGAWCGVHFTAAELDDPLISGPTANPDADPQVNLLEFLLGTDPKASNAPPGLRIEQSAAGLELVWQRSPTAASLFLSVQRSSDLEQWTLAPFFSQVPEVRGGSVIEALHFPLGAPTNSSARFYRVQVSETPLPLSSNNF